MAQYKRFFLMIGLSGIVMHAVMYLHTYTWSHVYYSEMRVYMTVLMVCTMTLIMWFFMRDMYQNRRINQCIVGGSIAVFILTLFLVRSQVIIDDVKWMQAMIPHHSIAILTSERAHLSDPEVRQLADEIIEAQRREIAEMERLIEELEQRER